MPVVAGMNPKDLRRGVDAGVKVDPEQLEETAEPISKPGKSA